MPKNEFTWKMNDFDTSAKKPNNVGDLGKIIVAISFELLPKVQKIAKSGHTVPNAKPAMSILLLYFWICNTVKTEFCLVLKDYPTKIMVSSIDRFNFSNLSFLFTYVYWNRYYSTNNRWKYVYLFKLLGRFVPQCVSKVTTSRQQLPFEAWRPTKLQLKCCFFRAGALV